MQTILRRLTRLCLLLGQSGREHIPLFRHSMFHTIGSAALKLTKTLLHWLAGCYGPRSVVLAATYTNATTSATPVLSIPVNASMSYTVSCHGVWKAAASGEWSFGITGPVSPALVTYSFTKTNALCSAAPTPLEYDGTGSSYPTVIGATPVGTAATDMAFDVVVGFTNGTTAGTLAITGLTISTDTMTV